MSLPQSARPIDRQIALQMAALLESNDDLNQIKAEQVVNPKRRLADMTEGDVLVDCLGIGMRSETLNRRNYRREYITHAAVRCKLSEAKVTASILDELGGISQSVQTFFENLKSITVTDGTATLIKAEPFVHVSRSQLFGDGLFISPIEFTWVWKPGT